MCNLLLEKFTAYSYVCAYTVGKCQLYLHGPSGFRIHGEDEVGKAGRDGHSSDVTCTYTYTIYIYIQVCGYEWQYNSLE